VPFVEFCNVAVEEYHRGVPCRGKRRISNKMVGPRHATARPQSFFEVDSIPEDYRMAAVPSSLLSPSPGPVHSGQAAVIVGGGGLSNRTLGSAHFKGRDGLHELMEIKERKPGERSLNAFSIIITILANR